MGDSPIFNTVKQVAGFGVGTLAALDTIKGGGLGSYLMNRQRLMSDPGFRASLEGSPFQAGIFGVTGSTGPAPAPPSAGMYPATAATGGVAQPSDMVGPPPPGQQVAPPQMPAPTAQNVPGYEPGTPRAWHPLFSPYDPEQALKQQGFATSQIGLGSPDEGVRAQSKMAAGIPLTDPEMAAAVSRGRFIQSQLGPGGVVKLDIPGMTSTIGSPYTSIGTEEYPTYAAAAAAGQATGRTPMPSGRGTWILAPLPTAEQQRPATLEQPTRAAAPPAPAPATAAAPAPAPAPPPVPVQSTAPAQTAAAPPPPPPPAPARPAAPPSGPPLASAGAPQIFATPGMGPAYRPPGLPDMAPSVRVAPGSPPGGGNVGFPSPAFDEGGAAAPAPPPAPPPAQPMAQYAKPVAASGGRVDLNAPWLRQLEVERNLPPGTLSGMAEKESGGNALKVNQDPNSTASGLFQITAPTARAWGMTPADRFDPVKSATVTADILAQRAQQVGVERAIGMHYGGPGTPYNQVVGASGLSPAAYSVDVQARAQKYTGATDGTIGYPSAAPQPVDYRSLPFRMTAPDLTPTALGLPPPLTLFPAPAGTTTTAGPLAEPETKVPLDKITVRDQSGREQTYAVPSVPSPSQAANMKLAGFEDFRQATPAQIQDWKQREDADTAQRKQMDADIARARGATPADLRKAQTMYANYGQAVTKLVTDFPKPEDRAKYIGWLNQLYQGEWSAHIKEDPQFELFLNDVAPFQYRKPEDIKGAIDQQEQQDLFNMLPTGKEPTPIGFEQRLQGFNDHVNFQLGLLNAQQQMAPNEMTTAWWNAVKKYGRDQLVADKQAAADALTAENQQAGRVVGTYVGAALGAPPAAAVPEAPPSTVVIAPPSMAAPPATTPPPFTVLGQWQE
jgi:hypothetical protein